MTVVALLALGPAVDAQAQTEVSGTIAANQTWTLAGSPYRVTGNVTVAAGVTLTIQSGVSVEFNQYFGLAIDGHLTVTGTAAAPVVFTGATAQKGWWRGINVRNAGSATLNYAVVRYSGTADTVGLLKSGSGVLTVRNSTFSETAGDGLRLSNSTGATLIEQSTFTGNSHSGLQLSGSQATVADSTFTENTLYGIHKEPYNHLVDYASCAFSDNGIACVGVKGGNIGTTPTWASGATTFRVIGDVTVAEGASLTVGPGVTVEFNQYRRILIDGTLTAAGTPTAPITFTGTTQQAGWWRGIQIQNAGSATLDHAVVAYAGDHLRVGLLKSGDGALTVRNSTFRETIGDGLRLDNSTGATLIEQSTFTGNSHSGLQLSGSQATVTDCTFTENTLYGIHKEPYNHLIDYASCTFGDNGSACVGVKGGNIDTAPTWASGATTFRVIGDVTVDEGASLTVEAGVTVEFNQYRSLWIDGTLTAMGTPAAPITFTGTTQQAGWWRGIQVRNTGSATLDHAVVSYSGSLDSVGLLKSAYGTLTVRNSIIHNTAGDGLRLAAAGWEWPQNGVDGEGDGYLWGHSPNDLHNSYFIAPAQYHGDWRAYDKLRLVLWSRQGTYYDEDAGATWRGDVYLANGEKFVHTMLDRDHSLAWEEFTVQFDDPARQWTLGGGAADISEVLENVTAFHIRAEYGSGDTYSGLDNVALWEAGGAAPAIASTFPGSDMQSWTIDMGSAQNSSDVQDVGSFVSANNLFRHNTRGVWIGINASFDDDTSDFEDNSELDARLDGGTITREVAWSLKPAYSFFVSGSVTVAADGRVLIRPGTVIKFGQYRRIFVDGVFDALGTASVPVYFTDWRDDTVGGDTNKDGDDSVPVAGWWHGIVLRNEGIGTLTHAHVAYAGYANEPGLLKSGSGALTLMHSAIRNIAGAGLRLNNSTGEHQIKRNIFTENHVGVQIQNQAKTVALIRNRIETNRDFGVHSQNSAEVDARGNWWGDESGPFHATLNLDGLGDVVSDGVLFDPWRIIPNEGEILSPMRSGTLVVGDLLRFFGSEFAVPGISYRWNFGDGRESTAHNPSLMNFPATGDFQVTYTATTGDEDPYPDRRDYTVVANTGDIPDLRVTSVNVPSELPPGQIVHLHYTVRNVGQGGATGPWRDAVYFSRDGFLDIRDLRLGALQVDENVPVNGQYQRTISVAMPAVEDGAYHLILVANDEWTLLERHRLNNEYAAPVTAKVPALTESVPVAAPHGSGRVQRYYRIPAAGGPNMLLNVANLDPNLAVYLRFGSLPTRAAFDVRIGPNGPVIIPWATEGDWYVLVAGDASMPGEYTLQFDMVDLILTRTAPARYGTVADLNLSISGAGFTGTLGVDLVAAGGAVYEAESFEVDSYSNLRSR